MNVQSAPEKQDLHRAAEEAPPLRLLRRPSASGFEFELADTPIELEGKLRTRAQEGNSVRLLSSYSREWKTVNAAAPHDLPATMQDFCEPYAENGQRKVWARVWNYIPQGGTDYTAFIRATLGSRMAEDPLSEVGCPYAVRGFDYDYVGILWLNDLLWRNDHWEINAATVYERGIANLARQARRERTQTGSATRELLQRTMQAYRILFTRALKGLCVWIPDAETRSYVDQSLS